MFEETFDVLRFVTCAECGFDDGVDMSVVVYGTVEVSDWVCPECGAVNEYRHDTAWDMADEGYAREKETW